MHELIRENQHLFIEHDMAIDEAASILAGLGIHEQVQPKAIDAYNQYLNNMIYEDQCPLEVTSITYTDRRPPQPENETDNPFPYQPYLDEHMEDCYTNESWPPIKDETCHSQIKKILEEDNLCSVLNITFTIESLANWAESKNIHSLFAYWKHDQLSEDKYSGKAGPDLKALDQLINSDNDYISEEALLQLKALQHIMLNGSPNGETCKQTATAFLKSTPHQQDSTAIDRITTVTNFKGSTKQEVLPYEQYLRKKEEKKRQINKSVFSL